MSKQTTEKAFETYVEEIVIAKAGWTHGEKSEWDKQNALFPERVFSFIADTQPKLWREMRKLHGNDVQPMLIKALVKELSLKGTLHILRHGFKFYGKIFRLAYFKPAHGLSPDVVSLYEKNQLTVTRQILCHPGDGSTVDMVLSLNGLPIATVELKNPQTGQTWRRAIKQYREDREPSAPLFGFKTRSLVHFAADSEELYMTTRLRKEKTFFLPFNRGSYPGNVQCGAGNPGHSSGYRTGYFWEEVLQRDSFLDIIGHFMFVEKTEEKIDDGKGGSKVVVKETMIFPRYHQLDAVRKLIAVTRSEGSGNNYLIQHSAGSGKTNSISWLSHRLASLHNDADEKVFDCVIVITDRQVLDTQLQEAVYQIEHAQGVVQLVDEDSKQLAKALVDGTKIVVTTLQKFPWVLNGLLKTAGAEDVDNPDEAQKQQAKDWEDQIATRKYAVIVDEAHSSQTGESARELKQILGASGESIDAEADWEDGLNQVMQSRGKQPNISFFAFTATPKGKTIDLFGRRSTNGEKSAFHIYSMRQAIEEGFILDVLKRYTTYKTYYRLVKAAEDDPDLPKRKGARALAKFMSLHPHNIEQKIEVIVEHFRRSVRHELAGRAKAMVVTSSRLHAVKYKLALERYLQENGYDDIRALVAFSGKVKIPADDSDYTGPDSSEYTEPGMNADCVTGKPISEKQLKGRFASNDYQILLVANKYQTGFDQPLLFAMYVDKRLDGVQAVQTLSRLNRKIPGKDDPFVLDFVNEANDIYGAFKPYFDATSLQEEADPAKLEELKHELDQPQIYHWSEVEAFAKVFYKLPAQQRAKDHADLNRWAQPCKDRFNALDNDDDDKWKFREKLAAYVQLYSFLSQIMPYCDPDLEKLYSFGKFVLPLLPTDRENTNVTLGDDVGLEYYRLSRIFSGPIDLYDGDADGVKSPTDVGTRKAIEELAPLSELIKVLNDKFGAGLGEADRLFFDQIRVVASDNPQVIQTANANPFDKFKLGIEKLIDSFMIERMAGNDEIVTKYMENPKFRAEAFPYLAKAIFDSVRDDDAEA